MEFLCCKLSTVIQHYHTFNDHYNGLVIIVCSNIWHFHTKQSYKRTNRIGGVIVRSWVQTAGVLYQRLCNWRCKLSTVMQLYHTFNNHYNRLSVIVCSNIRHFHTMRSSTWGKPHLLCKSWTMGSNLDKPKTTILVFVATPLSTHH